MIEPILDRVRARVSGERALESVRAIARHHRVQSSPGYDAAAEWLCEELERAGLEPEVDRVPGDGRTRFLGYLGPEAWDCAHAEAWLVDGTGARARLCANRCTTRSSRRASERASSRVARPMPAGDSNAGR